jgi:D-serine deaminase-like pyridoxal phosphate-dependent protein
MLIRHPQVLLGFPLFPSAVSRLATIASTLGPGSVSVLVDHPHQLDAVSAIRTLTPGHHPLKVFIKIDTSEYRRAGVVNGGLPVTLAPG